MIHSMVTTILMNSMIMVYIYSRIHFILMAHQVIIIA